MATIKVRIPAIVTADGKWAASGSLAGNGEADWSWLDEMCDPDNPTVNPQRVWIEAELPIPETAEVKATSVNLES